MAFGDAIEADIAAVRDDFGGVFAGSLVIGGETVSVYAGDEESADVLADEGAGVETGRVVRVVSVRSAWTTLPSDKDVGTLDGANVTVVSRSLDPYGVEMELRFD